MPQFWNLDVGDVDDVDDGHDLSFLGMRCFHEGHIS